MVQRAHGRSAAGAARQDDSAGRLADRRLPNVTRYDRPMDDLALPADRFDAVVAAMVFHDLFWLSEDVPAVLSQIYTAMRPGATMLITDHAAPEAGPIFTGSNRMS